MDKTAILDMLEGVDVELLDKQLSVLHDIEESYALGGDKEKLDTMSGINDLLSHLYHLLNKDRL